ncbi:MAG: hypothetical protein KF773_33265 [Deltaproteobacteria bacterium]|nr:hypothetical protein [Deltaproteobacteria bacterium]MCW5808471.1 hypothetical protein [Deltaproteobacteria bacterium]
MIRRALLPIALASCATEHGSRPMDLDPDELDFGGCEVADVPDCEAINACSAAGFEPLDRAVWLETPCRGEIHLLNNFIAGPQISFGLQGATTYDIVENDGLDCPTDDDGGGRPVPIPPLLRAQARFDGVVGRGRLQISSGGTRGAPFTRGFADVRFDDGRRVAVKFVAMSCVPIGVTPAPAP